MTQELSLQQLSQFTGEGDSPVYISVKGVIYDVTPAKEFYGPGKFPLSDSCLIFF